jgi:hypothetical protein
MRPVGKMGKRESNAVSCRIIPASSRCVPSLSLISSTDEVSTRLVAMTQVYTAKADAIEAESMLLPAVAAIKGMALDQ